MRAPGVLPAIGGSEGGGDGRAAARAVTSPCTTFGSSRRRGGPVAWEMMKEGEGLIASPLV